MIGGRHPLRRRTPSFERTPALGGLGWVVLGLSAFFLAAGILMPAAAEGLLRLYILSLAGGFVAMLASDSGLPRRQADDTYSPFTDERAARPAPDAPPGIRRRAAQLRAVDVPARAAREPIPLALKWAVIEEMSHRLSERHGLELTNPEHHPVIRALVSGSTWRLVRPSGKSATGSGADRAPDPPVSIAHLNPILDDVERL